MSRIKYLALGTLILSLIFHIVVARIFVFEFSIKPESLKPSFIFLGSILKSKDTQFPSDPSHIVDLPETYSLNTINPPSKPTSHTQFAPDKPHPKGEWKDKHNKSTSKSTFELPILSSENNYQDPYLQPKSPSLDVYKPLRLHEND